MRVKTDPVCNSRIMHVNDAVGELIHRAGCAHYIHEVEAPPWNGTRKQKAAPYLLVLAAERVLSLRAEHDARAYKLLRMVAGSDPLCGTQLIQAYWTELFMDKEESGL